MAKILFSILGRTWSVQIISRETKKYYVFGYCNRTKDGKYVVCIDYDRVASNHIRDELLALQEEYDLGTFYVFKSGRNGFHAVCVDKVPYKLFRTVISASSCDEDYVNVPVFFGRKLWVLRSTAKKDSEKPCLVFTLCRESARVKSRAHLLILQKFYGVNVVEDNADSLVEATMVRYKT